ncbi:hypothetical protein ABDK00_003745 [Niabella insulamsoli]
MNEKKHNSTLKLLILAILKFASKILSRKRKPIVRRELFDYYAMYHLS